MMIQLSAPTPTKDPLTTRHREIIAVDNWTGGVYFLPKSLRTAILAINELPVTDETLWFC